ncbi:MAG: MAPEG family protein, partial [Planktomarina sp.]
MLIVSGWTVLICAAFYMALTRQVIAARHSQGVSLGDGGDQLMLRRIRGQANAAEQMPITLIALICAELLGANGLILAVCAALFVIGRLMHGIAFGWMTHSR